MKTTIKFVKLTHNAKAPVCGSAESAGYDLSAAIDTNVVIAPHQTVKIPTGLSMELPQNTFGGLYARSGIANREGLAPANKVGVIDSDYRGEIIVALHNHSDEYRIVEPGQRIAQLIIQPYIKAEYEESDGLTTTDRGTGGFGSTGK